MPALACWICYTWRRATKVGTEFPTNYYSQPVPPTENVGLHTSCWIRSVHVWFRVCWSVINEITVLSCRDFRRYTKPPHTHTHSHVWRTDAIFYWPRLICIFCKHLLVWGSFDLQLKEKNNSSMQGLFLKKRLRTFPHKWTHIFVINSGDFRFPVGEMM